MLYCVNEEEQLVFEEAFKIQDYNLCRLIIDENLNEFRNNFESRLISNNNLNTTLDKYRKLLQLNNLIMSKLDEF